MEVVSLAAHDAGGIYQPVKAHAGYEPSHAEEHGAIIRPVQPGLHGGLGRSKMEAREVCPSGCDAHFRGNGIAMKTPDLRQTEFREHGDHSCCFATTTLDLEQHFALCLEAKGKKRRLLSFHRLD